MADDQPHPGGLDVDVHQAFARNDCLQTRPVSSGAALPNRPKRLTVIVNPYSGNGKGSSSLAAASRVFAEAGIETAILRTERPKHAYDLVQSIRPEETDGIVTIGGDGTLHEVLSGLVANPKLAMLTVGLIAGGTGNSVARSLGLLDPVITAKAIADGFSTRVDIGRCSATHAASAARVDYVFVNLIGLGIAVDAGKTAERLRFFGKIRYDMAGLWHIMKGDVRDFTVEIDGGQIQGDISVLVIQNDKFMGSGMRVAPGAKLDDGYLDTVLLLNEGRVTTLSLFNQLKNSGRHIFSKSVKYRQAKRILIRPAKPQPFVLDGELFDPFIEMEVEVAPQAIQFFVPSDPVLC